MESYTVSPTFIQKKSNGQKNDNSKNVSTVLALVLQNMWFNGEIDNAVWKLSQVTAENNSQFGNAYQQVL